MGEREEQVKVLSQWPSPFCMRVLIGLEEKGVRYEYQEENVLACKSELLLQTNPVYKRVPVLIHEGKPICESVIILQYIDEVWPGSNSFMPSNPYDRALGRFWADFMDTKFLENVVQRILKCTGEAQEEGTRYMLECLGLLEGELSAGGGKPYFAGDQFGFLDIVLIPNSPWFYALETLAKWKIPWDGEFPRLQGWMKRCLERESVKKILQDPLKVSEYAIQLRKAFVTSD
uniref:glutathione transferase n=2 Tax=Pinus subgen. Pinus TaxID=139271 RepID=A0A9E8M4X2_PINYU|nr:tau class glutathione S-transferases [Pinus densata]WAA68411.1 tau class glutathione S-transferases [Pinus yunnanensis]